MNVQKIVSTEEQAEKLVSLGFKIVEEKTENNDMETFNQEELMNMTMDQLKNICKDNNLEGYSKLGKDELINFIINNFRK
ncbi:hypothetical protein FC831_17600 [Clostridium botulinum]|nr:Rho termination factor N-terminal domain-containing protein [Clostridium botulinum]NFH02050.1 hypothetical protein [Clostridium botulinum]NFP40506.1 hypothetical protein [Clostridium botulinum]NFQ57974.1 hypothetical protein [Clostridium botulinum]